jgi:hypothetical protein
MGVFRRMSLEVHPTILAGERPKCHLEQGRALNWSEQKSPLPVFSDREREQKNILCCVAWWLLEKRIHHSKQISLLLQNKWEVTRTEGSLLIFSIFKLLFCKTSEEQKNVILSSFLTAALPHLKKIIKKYSNALDISGVDMKLTQNFHILYEPWKSAFLVSGSFKCPDKSREGEARQAREWGESSDPACAVCRLIKTPTQTESSQRATKQAGAWKTELLCSGANMHFLQPD